MGHSVVVDHREAESGIVVACRYSGLVLVLTSLGDVDGVLEPFACSRIADHTTVVALHEIHTLAVRTIYRLVVTLVDVVRVVERIALSTCVEVLGLDDARNLFHTVVGRTLSVHLEA